MHAILFKVLLMAALIYLPTGSFAEELTLSGHEIRMQQNSWSWRVVDESGKPLPGVMVFDAHLWFSSRYTNGASVDAAANALHLPKDITPICEAIETWIRENPEPMELAQLESMYSIALPFSLLFRNITDKKGLHGEERIWGEQPADSLRVFFKPGYYPMAIQYGFGPPPLRSDENIFVTVQMKQWPDRMQTLSQRPWVKENLDLQLKNDIQRRKSYKSNSIFINYPSLKLAQQIKALESKAIKGTYTKDAAWLHIASAYAPKQLEHKIDSSGEEYNLLGGRIYIALDEAVKIEPNIRILSGRKSIRDFILRFPNGIIKRSTLLSLDLDIPNVFFNNEATWTKPILADYFTTIQPYEDDPLLAIALTSQLAGNGLLLLSEPELRETFFSHRTQLRKKLLSIYPTISWHSSGFDRWDMVYDKAFDHPYYLKK